MLNWKIWSVSKYKHWLVQFLVAALFVGLAFRLVFIGFNPDLETHLIDRAEDSREPLSDSASSPLSVSGAEGLAAKPPVSAAVDDVGDEIQGPIGSLGVTGNEVPEAKPPVSAAVDEVGDEIQGPIGSLGVAGNEVPEAKPPVSDKAAEPPVAGDVREGENRTSSGDLVSDKCDLFAGDWVPDPSGPMYTNKTCVLIEGHQNCMRNGRPDTGYLYWRWGPKNCELPRFDPRRFLDLMRNKTWGLIGDSISRNHVQSLLCMLSTVEQGIEVYHDEAWKSKRWFFPKHNLTISVLWSPFLVQAAIFEDNNGVSSAEAQLHLDKLDKTWTDQYQSFDYVIISSGKWFLKTAIYHANNTVLGCHNCSNRNLTNLGFDFAYRKALRSALTFIATTKHNGTVLFRTSTPDHFENGEWNNAGNCPATAPAKDGSIQLKDLHWYLRHVELSEFGDAARKAGENGVDLRLLDLLKLSLLRPDGHPGPYRHFQPFAEDKNATVQNDCLHWCLPGPIDAWNDVIMEMMLGGR